MRIEAFMKTRQLYRSMEHNSSHYVPKHEMRPGKGGKGRSYTISWWDRDLIFIMAEMNLPACVIAKAAGLNVITIQRFLSKHGIYRDEVKVAKVCAEIKKSTVIARLLLQQPVSYSEYLHYARRISKSIIKRWIDLIDAEKLLGATSSHVLPDSYCVDHILSLYEGHRKNVPLHIICHPVNMRVITRRSNTDKGRNSSVSLIELENQVFRFNQLCDPFTDFPLPHESYSSKYVRGTYYQ